MIDTKVVELGMYRGIPHLMTPIANKPETALELLNDAITEMTNRYNTFASVTVQDIESYRDKTGVKMPDIIIVIDELADLMKNSKDKVEKRVNRLASLARAAGIYLIFATQRPSTNVISGSIKANLPSRVALKVAGDRDSITILDKGGAEKLTGQGDMLFKPTGYSKPKRLQGLFLSKKEIRDIADIYPPANQNTIYEKEPLIRIINASDNVLTGVFSESNNDNSLKCDQENGISEKAEKAIKCAIGVGEISKNKVQEWIGARFNEAQEVYQEIENLGIIDSSGKPKKLTIKTLEELEEFKANFKKGTAATLKEM